MIEKYKRHWKLVLISWISFGGVSIYAYFYPKEISLFNIALAFSMWFLLLMLPQMIDHMDTLDKLHAQRDISRGLRAEVKMLQFDNQVLARSLMQEDEDLESDDNWELFN